VLGSVLIPGTASFAQAPPVVKLAWDSNSEPDIAGYVVHVGTTPGTFTERLTVTRPQAPSDLAPFVYSPRNFGTYHFAVQAYTTENVFSPLSTPISVRISGQPTADGVSPSSGSGSAGTFALQYSHTEGASKLATAWAWFNTSASNGAANSCLVYYEPATRLLKLANNAGSGWAQAPIGSSTVLENSQCSIDAGATGAVVNGTTLTISLQAAFKSGFAGTKKVYMHAAGASGPATGWQHRGNWTVAAPIQTRSSLATSDATSVTPSTGNGTSRTFALRYSDSASTANLETAWVWFNDSIASTAAGSCLAYYKRSSNHVYLLNDAGTAWQSVPLGSALILENSQCAIGVGGSSVSSSGSTLTVNLPVAFKPSFTGEKNIYMFANDGRGSSTGWQDRGDFTVGSPTVAVRAITPSPGVGSSGTFALEYSSSRGAADVRYAWVWFKPTSARRAPESCLIYFDQPTGMIALVNDAATTWSIARLGSGGTLQNSQCAIATGESRVVASGSTLTLHLKVTFKAAFAGEKEIHLFGKTAHGPITGWQRRGSWTVN
jgi:hypothetical protein